ncbi:MAG: hypothetical protein ACLQNE_45655 [Thermoguttaceae bacterium]
MVPAVRVAEAVVETAAATPAMAAIRSQRLLRPILLPSAFRRYYIINPVATGAALSFSIDGQVYSLAAGEWKDFNVTPDTVVQFDRGKKGEMGRYSVTPGQYTFAATPAGWELYRSTSTLPANPAIAAK